MAGIRRIGGDAGLVIRANLSTAAYTSRAGHHRKTRVNFGRPSGTNEPYDGTGQRAEGTRPRGPASVSADQIFGERGRPPGAARRSEPAPDSPPDLAPDTRSADEKPDRGERPFASRELRRLYLEISTENGQIIDIFRF